MDRRQFVASLGVLAGGGAAAMGTGAFSSVQADRNVDVVVEDDASAYLGIRPTNEPNGNYADDTGNGELSIDLSGSNGNLDNGGISGGKGLNTNALTTMADVFEVVNQGTQTVELDVEPLLYLNLEAQDDELAGLLVLLVPQNPDQIGADIYWNDDDDNLEGLTAIKDLDPGQKLRFGILGFAAPESAIDLTSVDSEVRFEATEV